MQIHEPVSIAVLAAAERIARYSRERDTDSTLTHDETDVRLYAHTEIQEILRAIASRITA
jgi:hypothetical protein